VQGDRQQNPNMTDKNKNISKFRLLMLRRTVRAAAMVEAGHILPASG